MSLTQCAKCSEEVFLPTGASPEATVRCPFCSEEFELSEVLDKLPPTLLIVSDPQGGATANEAASSGTGFSFDGLADDGESGSPAFDPHSSSSEGAVKTLAKPASRSGRKKAPPKNAIFEIVKIVGGGVAGILLAILIIWWGVRTDPFGFAPNVAEYVPFIVPAHLRGDSPVEDSTDGDADGDSNPADNQNANNKPKGNKNQKGNRQNPPDPNAFRRPLGGAQGPFAGNNNGNSKQPALDGADIDIPEIDPTADSGEFDPLALPGDGLGDLDPDALDPDLSELNPDLNELDPDLGELNPDLGELNPDLGELNPDLNPDLNPEIDPEAGSDPAADPESEPKPDPETV